jgi:ApaLI-like restriction endonuclease
MSLQILENQISELALKYRVELDRKITLRVEEMNADNNDHYLIYKLLGVTFQEGQKIDIYQNKGRFLYKYAGSFLEEVVILCFEYKFKNAQKKIRIENKIGQKPKTFEIDCLVENRAYEIKWRDATTDGDHITKEHTRLKNISEAGYVPVRLMFYYPNRTQAIRIQDTLKTIYVGIGGEYYFGESAWKYIQKTTRVDLLKLLTDISNKII